MNIPGTETYQDMSWVIRNKETGEVILETWQSSLVEKLNTAKYEAVGIYQHLREFNERG
jgi:hypothetical protein